jgi:hypothetical protein
MDRENLTVLYANLTFLPWFGRIFSARSLIGSPPIWWEKLQERILGESRNS